MVRMFPNLQHHFKGYCFYGEIILMFVYMKLRYALSFRDLEEIMTIRGLTVDHSTIQRWVFKFSILIENQGRSSMNTGGSIAQSIVDYFNEHYNHEKTLSQNALAFKNGEI